MKTIILFSMIFLSGCAESAESALSKKMSVGDCVDIKQSSSSVSIPGQTVSGPFDRDIRIPSTSTTVTHDSFIINVYKGSNRTCAVEVDEKSVAKKQKITELGADYIVIDDKKIIPVGRINEMNLLDWKKFYESEVKRYREEKTRKEKEVADHRAAELASKRIETDERHAVKLRCKANYKAAVVDGKLVKENTNNFGKYKDFFIGVSAKQFASASIERGCAPKWLKYLEFTSIQFEGEPIKPFSDFRRPNSYEPREICMDKYRASELEKTSLGLSRTLVFESSSLLWLSHKIDPNIVGTQGDDELKCENFGKHVSRSFMFIENIKSEKTSIFVGECDFFKSIWQFEPWNIEPDQLWDFKNCRPMPVPD